MKVYEDKSWHLAKLRFQLVGTTATSSLRANPKGKSILGKQRERVPLWPLIRECSPGWEKEKTKKLMISEIIIQRNVSFCRCFLKLLKYCESDFPRGSIIDSEWCRIEEQCLNWCRTDTTATTTVNNHRWLYIIRTHRRSFPRTQLAQWTRQMTHKVCWPWNGGLSFYYKCQVEFPRSGW